MEKEMQRQQPEGKSKGMSEESGATCCKHQPPRQMILNRIHQKNI